jgi:hypothetical protein
MFVVSGVVVVDDEEVNNGSNLVTAKKPASKRTKNIAKGTMNLNGDLFTGTGGGVDDLGFGSLVDGGGLEGGWEFEGGGGVDGGDGESVGGAAPGGLDPGRGIDGLG